MAELSAIACRVETSRGRFEDEEASPTRSAFQRDRDRVIHSTAFRRLKHKTQVFVYREGDHYRTRLTHSLEVSQIARSMARVLGLDEDLAEALALAHDLGHPPFGHAGEEELSNCMEPFGGFDHNAQTLRVVTKLERRYADFDGLNLCWETLEGIVKHNGPLIPESDSAIGHLPMAYKVYERLRELDLHLYASAEAQVAALADDIAYDNHDIDDGLRAGLFSVDDLMDLPFVSDVIGDVRSRYPDLELSRLVHETVRRSISAMVGDALSEAGRRIKADQPASADDVRRMNRPVIAFSEEMSAHEESLKSFLMESMYHHYKVNRMMSQARRIVKDLFDVFVSQPGTLPTEWRNRCDGANTPKTARVVCDFIAGMTDRFAVEEHKRLFSFDLGA